MIIGSIRVFAVLFGVFCLLTSSMDILGMIPYSQETPPLGRRIAHALPVLTAGVFLVIPYRAVRSRASRGWVGLMLCLIVAWLGYRAGEGVVGYARGERSWHVLPLAMLLPALALANLWAFVRITQRSRAPSPERLPTTGQAPW